VVLLEGVVAGAEHVNADRAQMDDDIVLRRAMVAGREDLGPARLQGLEQNSGLGFEVQRHSDAPALEGTGLGEVLAGRREQGHAGAGPADPAALGGIVYLHHAGQYFIYERGFHIRGMQ
jgi:hypothetical protein